MSDENTANAENGNDADAPDVVHDAPNVDEDGTVIGTDEQPLTDTVNTEADPHPNQPENGHRYGERHGGNYTAEGDDGETLTWTDPDAVPGTVGDTPEDSIRAVASAGLPAVEVQE